MAKSSDKENILKQQEKRRQLHTREPDKAISWFFSRILIGQKGAAWYIQNDERKKTADKNTLSRKAKFKLEGEIKHFPEKQKLKELMTTKPVLWEMLKGPLLLEMKDHKQE